MARASSITPGSAAFHNDACAARGAILSTSRDSVDVIEQCGGDIALYLCIHPPLRTRRVSLFAPRMLLASHAQSEVPAMIGSGAVWTQKQQQHKTAAVKIKRLLGDPANVVTAGK
jgi:hypothetical protein